jgi:uncharacterized protein YdhG (YjbR/CyaY superfamily)
MSPTKAAKKPAKSAAKPDKGFTAAEKAAMKERAKELKAEEKASKNRAAGEKAVLAAIKAMGKPDRVLAEKIHALVTTNAPNLWPKTWYGMPAYTKDGKVVVFFQPAEKFEARYATLGFNDAANLDDGNLWSTSFAVKALTPAEEKKITALVKKAVK